MTDLLVELWHLIFKRLELVDLSACAQVSKQFNLMVKDYRIKEIAFIRGTNYRWFHYVFLPYDHEVDYSKASVLKRSSFNFDHLKKLKIGRWSSFDLSDINKFTQLEMLDIDLKNYQNKESLTLCLPNLSTLFVFVPPAVPYLELDTPRLLEVRTFHLEKLEFVHPKSVQEIRTFSHGGNLFVLFPNLRLLTFTDLLGLLDFREYYKFETLKEFSATTIRKKLKGIYFFFGFNECRARNLDICRRIIRKVLDMQWPELKVFWQGVQITDVNQLTEQHVYPKQWSAFLLKRCEESEPNYLPSREVIMLEFNATINTLEAAGFDLKSKEFASELSEKILIKELIAHGRVNEPKLLVEFILRSPTLGILRFKNSGLDASFFRYLLEIIETNHIPLFLFEIDQLLPLELVTKLLGLPQLEAILFSVDRSKIERISPNRFRMDGNSFDLAGLQEYLEAKRNSAMCNLM